MDRRPLGLIDQFNLRKSLGAVLDRASDSYESSFSKQLKRRAIANGRSEIFAIYDNFLAARCSDKNNDKERLQMINAVWDMITEFLFRLDKIGMHHSCFEREVEYLTVVYDD